ncbi:CPBP family intramembrane glutamic endopeptidase [Halorientalis litorea]|uniref:CPBP family intramembrane glutamic endopeptidase n=1 Tax=Halorientalis litorea TaxID=2931977 RepID=UPI001FF35481|nr:type II CAAX endopeptidase family protein [Halorientalis litorea]
MPQWGLFVGLTGVVLTLLLLLARASQTVVRSDGRADADPTPRPASGTADDTHRLEHPDPTAAVGAEDLQAPPPAHETVAGDHGTLSPGALLANVALTQGLFGGLLLAAAWYTEMPLRAFGVTAAPLSTGLPALGVGVALGITLYAANEIGAASADAIGVEYDERLRSMLSPDTTRGWLTLLLVVLPIVAGVEEFIFRAAVVGATTAGFAVSPWAMAVVSSLAFALGHGAQGRVGIVVTGSLGFVLAGAFILTGSFLVVFVAHYLVNALEFVVHELLGIEWGD